MEIIILGGWAIRSRHNIPPFKPYHCGTIPSRFETSNHSLSHEGVSEWVSKPMSAAERATKWLSDAKELGNGQASVPVLTSLFIAVLNHGASLPRNLTHISGQPSLLRNSNPTNVSMVSWPKRAHNLSLKPLKSHHHHRTDFFESKRSLSVPIGVTPPYRWALSTATWLTQPPPPTLSAVQYSHGYPQEMIKPPFWPVSMYDFPPLQWKPSSSLKFFPSWFFSSSSLIISKLIFLPLNFSSYVFLSGSLSLFTQVIWEGTIGDLCRQAIKYLVCQCGQCSRYCISQSTGLSKNIYWFALIFIKSARVFCLVLSI